MPIMKHKEFGTHDIADQRVKKLLKRGWKIVEEVQEIEPVTESKQTTQTPDELDDENNQGDA